MKRAGGQWMQKRKLGKAIWRSRPIGLALLTYLTQEAGL
jgi:hypothetical protein